MRLKLLALLLLANAILASSHLAEAQQPGKLPRIGYLAGATPSGVRPAPRHSAKGCASLDTWRGKTLPLSGVSRRGN
jgi:hypothetical protein